MVRFIHAADLHIDRPFEGLHQLDPQLVANFTAVNQQVLENIVTAAIEERVDFLILAGDTFHQNRPSLNVQQQFIQQMERLEQAAVPVYLIFGNHDYYEPERYWFDFPPNVRLFTTEEVATIVDQTPAGESYAISGFSYTQPWIKKSKVAEFPNRKAVTTHIGIYHGEINSERFAPFTISELKQKGYDYWALGHVHVPQVLAENPLICYPGTPQGHNRKETQVAGVQLVEIQNGHVRKIPLSVAEIQWQNLSISLEDCHEQKKALQVLRSRLVQAIAELPQLVQLKLQEVSLGPDFKRSLENFELLAYLNDYLQREELELLVSGIDVETTSVDKQVSLPAPAGLINELLNAFSNAEIFDEALADLKQQGILAELTATDFQEEVLASVQQQLHADFSWSEKE